MAKRITIRVPAPKLRKPVARKANSRMKSARDYTRKKKHRKSEC